jgi:hypothetical protein
MASAVTKIEFYNKLTVPTELIGKINPVTAGADKFECKLDNPPVGDDKIVKMYAIATFQGGSYSVASPDIDCAFNVTKQPLFDKPEIEYPTEDTIDLDNTMDCSFITDWDIDADSITKFELQWKLQSDADWENSEDLTPSLADNIFTATFELDVTDEDMYMVRIRAFDNTMVLVDNEFVSEPIPSEWSPIKYINKNVFLGVDDAGTDWWTWDDAGSDKILY